MTEEKFKVSSVALDISTNDGALISSLFKPEYIVTSISANNDCRIGEEASRFSKTSKLIVKADFSDSLEEILLYHLDELSWFKADIVLLSPDIKWESLPSSSPIIGEFGVDNPSSTERLDEIMKIRKISYVGLPISPLNYNYEVLEWCKSNNVKVIGFNPLGGHLSAQRDIEAFTVPYLLKFCSANCDILVLSGRDNYKTYRDFNYLVSEVFDHPVDLGKFTMGKSIFKPVKEIKKAIYTSLQLDEEGLAIVDYDDPSSIYPEISFSIGKKQDKIPTKSGSDLEKQLEVLHIPSDVSEESTRSAIIRYKAKEFLLVDHKPDDGWLIRSYVVNPDVIVFSLYKPSIKRRFWQKPDPEESRTITIIVTPDIKDIVVKEENALPEP